jgi:hypothetical protein
MARDKKASFKFTTSTLSAPRLVSTATADKLSTAITYSAATTVAYQSVSDVFSSPNMILAAAADFASQADTAASGSSDLPGINGQGQSLFVKVIVSNNASVANAGSPMLQVFGSAASTVDAQGKLSSSPVEISAGVVITTTVSTSAVYYLPVLSAKPYWQLQLNGTASGGTSAGVVTIQMAGLVNGRDGAVSL